MKFINAYIKLIDTLNRLVGSSVAWLNIILILIICYDVISRYLFGEGSVALQELEWHLFAIIFLVSAGYTLQADEHVRVDVFYTKLNDRQKAWINLLGSVIFLIPLCIVVIISSEKFVLTSFQLGETSPDAGGLPGRYILKAFIPISFFLLMLEGISLALKSYIKIKTDSVGQEENL